MPTKGQFQKRIEELEQENDDLQDQLDQIYDIVAPSDEQQECKRDAVTARRKPTPPTFRAMGGECGRTRCEPC